MIITNKVGFTIMVILGVLLALFILGLLLYLIAVSEAEAKEMESKKDRSTTSTRKSSKGYGNGCSQLVALLLGIVLLLIAILR